MRACAVLIFLSEAQRSGERGHHSREKRSNRQGREKRREEKRREEQKSKQLPSQFLSVNV
jgi:hypothetical protein